MVQDPGSVLVRDSFQALSYLPWSGYVQGLESNIETHILSAFFTTEWLSNDHEGLMLELLKIDLRNAGQYDIFVEHTAFMLLLTAACADQKNYALDRHYAWLRKRGEDLATGRKSLLATIINKNGNHWVGMVINFVLFMAIQWRTRFPLISSKLSTGGLDTTPAPRLLMMPFLSLIN